MIGNTFEKILKSTSFLSVPRSTEISEQSCNKKRELQSLNTNPLAIFETWKPTH